MKPPVLLNLSKLIGYVDLTHFCELSPKPFRDDNINERVSGNSDTAFKIFFP